MTAETISHPVTKATGLKTELFIDSIVRETPLTLYFNDEEIVTLLCSPSQMEELALGFLLSEGFIADSEDVTELRLDQKENLVWITGKPRPMQAKLMSKRFLSACCGKSRSSFYFANDAKLAKPIQSDLTVTLSEAYGYADYLENHLPLFQNTGGVHSGALARAGEVLFTAYDIGRHNVFDKLYGNLFKNNLSAEDHVIFFSGRVSSEILLKVAKMGVPILIARSAPTDLALSLAADLNITVIGFARGERLNIYTCPERVIIA